MNNTFSSNSLQPQQQHQQQILHQASPNAAGTLSYLQQHQQHLAAAAASAAASGASVPHTTTTALFDPRNTILITNNFPHHQALSTALPPPQTLHTAYNNTNNNTNNNNIRIVSTAANTLQPGAHHVFSINNNNDSGQLVAKETQSLQLTDAFTPLFHHPQNQSSQQSQPQVQVQHQHFTSVAAAQHHLQQHQLSTLLPQHYAAQQQHYAAQGAHAFNALQLTGAATPATYYVPAESASGNGTAVAGGSTANIIAGISAATAPPPVPPTQAQASSTTGTSAAGQSTVLLDRINICINNHYTDSMSSSGGAPGMTGSSAGTTPTPTTQQPSSPIIPAIQHKPAAIDASMLLLDAYASNDDSSTLVIDEPDSTTTTTTPHTPPTTPENSSPITIPLSGEAMLLVTADMERQHQSPSRTFAMDANIVEMVDSATSPAKSDGTFIIANETYAIDALMVEDKNEEKKEQQQQIDAALELKLEQTPAPAHVAEHRSPLTSPTMPTPPPSAESSPPEPTPPPSAESSPPEPPPLEYASGEDVFIKRQDDGRFYLGTIIDSKCQMFLVRFDDKSELWCAAEEMRKLGGGSIGGGSSGSCGSGASAATALSGPMCVTCKSAQSDDVVEICERCGRGYHRNCTTETARGSGDWFCKRCAKPMKIKPIVSEYKAYNVCRQLPYHVNALTWDDKHRVNEEQIYCYCGMSGKFDDNMLQCCKCYNWFHTRCLHCVQARNLTRTMLRGDGFFVFACSVCNEGAEFIRRLQIDWVDLLHLTLYNLSALKKHQHQKYHHLLKDIWPFLRERRRDLPIAEEWLEMSDATFLEQIKRTLRVYTGRFISGREIKRDHYYYGLRNNGPPLLPAIHVKFGETLNDRLLTQKLNLTLLLHSSPSRKGLKTKASKDVSSTPVRKTSASSASREQHTPSTKDIYEFRIEDEEKFTSDDEIPIKHIMEKVKKSGTTPTKVSASASAPPTQLSPAKAKDRVLKRSPSPQRTELEDVNVTTPKKCSEKKHSTRKGSSGGHGAGATPSKVRAIPSTMLSATADGEDVKDDTISAQVVSSSCIAVAPLTNTTILATTSSTTPRSRKRKTFTLSTSYLEIAKRNICYSSSDENSSNSSRCNSLDLMIPPSKDFLGPNNPFRHVLPKKSQQLLQMHQGQRSNGYRRGGVSGGAGGQKIIQNSIFNATSRLDLSSKLAALKSTGIFANLSTSNLAKAAGQPRTVRTIKRRLSAKDITIGPNQEVRRRRTRRQSSNVEVISTTTINTIPNNFFPLHAKDVHAHMSGTSMQHSNKATFTVHSSSSASSSPPGSTCSELRAEVPHPPPPPPPPPPPLTMRPATATHGRLLRQRPQKLASPPPNSRRNSLATFAGADLKAGATEIAAGGTVTAATTSTALRSLQTSGAGNNDAAALQKNVHRYFGVPSRFESGEPYRILARRWLLSGQLQYLIEWGVPQDYRSEHECEESSSECGEEEDRNENGAKEKKDLSETDTDTKKIETGEKDEVRKITKTGEKEDICEMNEKHESFKQEKNQSSQMMATCEEKENNVKNGNNDNNHADESMEKESTVKKEQSEKNVNEMESAA